MKILKVIFKNLTALVGEWEIDFTKPAFQDHGLFAIVGDTGAGKTTILDAICLSLYGQTPRLGKITKSSNDILSRGENECFAKTVFEAQGKQYLAFFGQQYSRNHQLQQQRMALSDFVSGIQISKNSSEVPELVEKLTGLDFMRFTRCLLLSQGQFAAFLSANPKERSEILEQITGTEFYSQIAIHVYKLYKNEKEKLEDLFSQLQAIKALTPEEEKNAREAKEQLENEISLLQQQADLFQEFVQWHQEIAAKKEEFDNSIKQMVQLKQQYQDNEPQFQLLKIDERARKPELVEHDSRIKQLGETIALDAQTIEEQNKRLPLLLANLETVQTQHSKATAHLAACKEKLVEQTPLIEKGKVLTVQLELKGKELEEANKELAHHTRESEKCTVEIRKTKETQAELEQKIEAVTSWLQAHADGALGSQLPLLEEYLQQLDRLCEQGLSKHKELALSVDAQTAAAAKLAQAKQEAESLERHCLELQVAVQEQEQVLKKTLMDQELTHWQQQKDYLYALQLQASAACQTGVELRRGSLALQNWRVEETREQERGLELQGQLKASVEQIQLLTAKLEQLEQFVALRKEIESLEEKRQQLREGCECPLCGSKEHPYVKAQPCAAFVSEQSLREAKEALEAAQKENTRYQTELARSQTMLASCQAGIKAKLQELELSRSSHQSLKTQISQQLSCIDETMIGSLPSVPESAQDQDEELRLESYYSDLLGRIEQGLTVLSDCLSLYAVNQKTLETRKANYEKAQLQYAELSRSIINLAHAAENAQENTKRLDQECQSLEQNKAKSLVQLAELYRPFGSELLTEQNVHSACNELRRRWSEWQDKQQLSAEQDKQHNLLLQQIAILGQQQQIIQQQIVEAGQKLQRLTQENSELRQSYDLDFALFAPTALEEALKNTIRQAENQLQSLAEHLDRGNKEYQLVIADIKSHRESLVHSSGLKQEWEQSFKSLLEKNYFSSLEEFRAASLDDEQRQIISEIYSQLNTQKILLEQQRSGCKERLEQLRSEDKTKQSLEACQAILVELLGTPSAPGLIAQKQTEVGIYKERLEVHARSSREAQAINAQINRQEQITNRWKALQTLLGDAEGKTYRTFAQSITFSCVLVFANQQLSKLTDRYELVLTREEKKDGKRESKREDKPVMVETISLEVIDRYQAGERRSVKNLSGGETFLVSLALALGLSQMASRNIRIDTLFLDEGFGTLDEDTLSMALDTLAKLHLDGKLIGVISHVQAIKDRIVTQIIAEKVGSGRSRLTSFPASLCRFSPKVD